MACNASAPAAAALPWSDNSRDGNTTQSQSEGAVWGDMHCPLCKQVLYHLLKTQGFYQADLLENNKHEYLRQKNHSSLVYSDLAAFSG